MNWVSPLSRKERGSRARQVSSALDRPRLLTALSSGGQEAVERVPPACPRGRPKRSTASTTDHGRAGAHEGDTGSDLGTDW
jgi:hypothetical protein